MGAVYAFQSHTALDPDVREKLGVSEKCPIGLREGLQ